MKTIKDNAKPPYTLPPKPPGPPGRMYKDYPLIGLVETKGSKLARVKYEAFMEGYNFALNRGSGLS